MTDGRVVAVTTDNTILAGLIADSERRVQAGRGAVQRRAVRHRRRRRTTTTSALHQRRARGDLRERRVGGGVRGDPRRDRAEDARSRRRSTATPRHRRLRTTTSQPTNHRAVSANCGRRPRQPRRLRRGDAHHGVAHAAVVRAGVRDRHRGGRCRVSPVPPLRCGGRVLRRDVRNTPLTVLFVLFFFGLTKVGIKYESPSPRRSSCSAATPARSSARRFAAGINSVSRGQAEAARALGLTFPQVLRMVVLPQALRTVVAPLGSLFIALIKNSSIAAMISVLELVYRTDQLANATARRIPVYLGAAAAYLVLTIPSGLRSACSSDGWRSEGERAKRTRADDDRPRARRRARPRGRRRVAIATASRCRARAWLWWPCAACPTGPARVGAVGAVHPMGGDAVPAAVWSTR